MKSFSHDNRGRTPELLRSFIAQCSYMFNFEVRKSIIFGFSFYWSWVWVVFWSSLFYNEAPTAQLFGILAFDSLGPLWSVSLFCMSVTLLILFVMSRKTQALGLHMFNVMMAAFPTAIGTLIVALPNLLFTESVMQYVYSIGVALLGIGSAFELVLWGELLTLLGARQSVVYFVSSTVCSVVIFVVMISIDPTVSRTITACFPFFGMALFIRQRPILERSGQIRAERQTAESSETSEQKVVSVDRNVSNSIGAKKQTEISTIQSLSELLVIALFFGISYGVMKGLFVFETSGTIFMRDQLNALALLLGSLAILVSMGIFRMNFQRMTYQIALPLMAAGFVLFPLEYPFNMAGFFLHQFGYQYFYAIIWAMWPVLSARCNAPRSEFVCIGLFGVQFGQLAGSVIGSLVIVNANVSSLGVFSSACVFITLLVALFAFNNTTSNDEWIMSRPFGKKEDRHPKFKLSLQSLSEARGLSPREVEVFELLAKGRNKYAIAKQLCISENTAKTHIKNIYRKLGVHSQQAMMDMIELDAKSR